VKSTDGPRDFGADPADSESRTKQQIWEKISQRLAGFGQMSFCPELNPDVIVISTGQSLLFEPQSHRAVEWLQAHLGFGNLDVRERVRVHPSQGKAMTDRLKAAGFRVC